MKPILFIGSSKVHLYIARAAEEELKEIAEVKVWDEGIFRLSMHTLDSLLATLEKVDFGIFVFAPDDLIDIGGAELKTTRDNVIFELGLFMGGLGPERCFVMEPSGVEGFRLPSDLAGVTTARYELPASSEQLAGKVADACYQIRVEIAEQGPRERGVRPSDVGDREHALIQILTAYEKPHLLNLVRRTTSNYKGRGSMRAELRHLRTLDLLKTRPDRAIGSMRTGLEFDLADYVELTDLGRRVAERLQ